MIRIRSAKPDDLSTIVDFQLQMARETEAIELNLATVSAGVAAVFADPAKGSYLVAEMDDRVVGGLLTIPEWSDWRNGTVLWIHSVYVAPGYRRRGLFRAMYEFLHTKVSCDPSLCGLRLYVHKDNHAAQSTYRMLGMDGEYYRMFEWMK